MIYFLLLFAYMGSTSSSTTMIIEEKPWKWKSKVMEEISLLSHSIFSTFIALYTLLLIYFPYYFFRIALFPLLICTSLLFIALLRSAAAETKTECGSATTAGTGENRADPECVLQEKENDAGSVIAGLNHLDPRPFCDEPIGWSIGASLEVIYEEDYEGEEEEEEEDEEIDEDRFISKLYQGYPSLSLFYSETDSSDDDEEEDVERDEMIEIALNIKGRRDIYYQDEDENLIEIDIFSSARTPEKIELTAADGQ